MDLTPRSQTLSEFPNFSFLSDPTEPKGQRDTDLSLIQLQQSCRKTGKFRNLMIQGRATHLNQSVFTVLILKKDKGGEITELPLNTTNRFPVATPMIYHKKQRL